MKFALADLPRIQVSLFAAVLMIAVGAAAAHFSLNLTKIAQLARNAATAERNEFEGKLKQVRDEENEIRQKSSLFSNLQARGVIGDEQRLDWVELLKDIRAKRRLLDLDYEISPQRPLDANPGNGLAFYASTMKLQLKLLHEEDLTRLLDDLHRQARALIQVKSCNVTRLPHGSAEQNGLANLQADCQIDWLTLHEAAK
jgi:hypothetical protein